jgi:hypothetical protein
MRSIFCFAIVLITLAACSEVDDPTYGQRESAVIGGTLDEGDPAVVAVLSETGLCTGTLIAPHVILTAAHCLEDATAEELTILFGSDAMAAGGDRVPAASLLIHPEYGDTHDIGLVELADASAVKPVPINAQALTPGLKGEDVRVVGFGVADAAGMEVGKKRTGTVSYDGHMADYMMVRPKNGQSGCFGDSGGPNFMTFDGVEVVAGVTSFGTAQDCISGLGGSTDVQLYSEWILEFVERAETPASCGVDHRCAADCATLDPDCACVADGACSDTCPDWLVDDPDCAGCGAGDGCWSDCPDTAPDPDCDADQPEPETGDGGGCSTSSRSSMPLALALLVLIMLADRCRVRR